MVLVSKFITEKCSNIEQRVSYYLRNVYFSVIQAARRAFFNYNYCVHEQKWLQNFINCAIFCIISNSHIAQGKFVIRSIRCTWASTVLRENFTSSLLLSARLYMHIFSEILILFSYVLSKYYFSSLGLYIWRIIVFNQTYYPRKLF